MRKREMEYCLFCGREAGTKDHVPSKNLFEKPFPDNLLTVPCCAKCNNRFSSDEEYFLNMLIQVSDNENLRRRISEDGAIYRSWQRSPILKQRLLEALVTGEDGRQYFKAEYSRIEKIIEKNASGLYYHRYGRRANIDKFKFLGFYPFSVVESRPAEIFLLTHTERFLPKKWITLQEDVFSYIVVRDWRRNNQLTMIFHMHNSAWCVIAIPSPRSNKNRLPLKKNQTVLWSR